MLGHSANHPGRMDFHSTTLEKDVFFNISLFLFISTKIAMKRLFVVCKHHLLRPSTCSSKTKESNLSLIFFLSLSLSSSQNPSIAPSYSISTTNPTFLSIDLMKNFSHFHSGQLKPFLDLTLSLCIFISLCL